MEEVDSFKPLLAVGMQHIRELAPRTSSADMDNIKKVFDDFIEERIQFDQAASSFKDIIGTIHPLEKINSILQVDDVPIPPQDENGGGNGSGLGFQSQNRKKTHPWSEIEDQRLMAAIHRFGLDNWATVSCFVGNARTRAQCSQRWYRGLDPRISKVLWTAEEDAKLIELVEKYGDRSWTKIASELGNRSDAQCRYHFRQISKEIEEDNEFGQLRTSSSTIPLTYVPTQSKGLTQQIIPSQSVLMRPSLERRIPPIDSFLEDFSTLPNHMKFNMPQFMNPESQMPPGKK